MSRWERLQTWAANTLDSGIGWTAVAVAILVVMATCGRAQVVRVQNYKPQPFVGWHSATVDLMPPHEAGITESGVRYVMGRRVGMTTRVVDLWLVLPASGGMVVDLSRSTALPHVLGPLPTDPATFGVPSIGHVPMSIVAWQPCGAAHLLQFRARVGVMLCADLWVRWYPDQPGIARAEALVTASNPAVPDMGAIVPPSLELRFGDALVLIPGRGIGPLIDAGTTLCDGQGKGYPGILLVWPRHLRRASDWSSVGVAADFGIGAVGISRLWPEGNPVFPPGFSARQWAEGKFQESVRRLHTWDEPVCGPSPRSANSGPQEDQLFWPGGEALQVDGVGCEWVRLLSACKLHAERAANHLEADGAPLDAAKHPGSLFWDSRAHHGISQDRLGKPRPITEEETHGRWGADVQHWLTRSLGSSARTTGSPLAQRLLRNMATVYLLQRTAVPGWSTTDNESARELGYEGLFVVQVDEDLEDRVMVAAVVQRFRDRMRLWILAKYAGKSVLRVFSNDSRLGPGDWAIGWQEALGAYGIDLASDRFGITDGRALALRVAKAVLERGWEQVNGRWCSRAQFPLSGPMPAADESFNGFGCPLAVAVVLRHEPTHEKARAIWAQVGASGTWVAPGLQGVR